MQRWKASYANTDLPNSFLYHTFLYYLKFNIKTCPSLFILKDQKFSLIKSFLDWRFYAKTCHNSLVNRYSTFILLCFFQPHKKSPILIRNYCLIFVNKATKCWKLGCGLRNKLFLEVTKENILVFFCFNRFHDNIVFELFAIFLQLNYLLIRFFSEKVIPSSLSVRL